MKALNLEAAARAAVAASPTRPATAVLHDTPDVRLLLFRLAPGQEVPPHRNPSTVLITVLAGSGVIAGEHAGVPWERACTAGDMVACEPDELHGMRAEADELLLLATIAPRPSSR